MTDSVTTPDAPRTGYVTTDGERFWVPCSTAGCKCRYNLEGGAIEARQSETDARERPAISNYTEEISKVFRILGNHEGLGCCDSKTLEHVAQSITEALSKEGDA